MSARLSLVDIEAMQEAGAVAGQILRGMKSFLRVGITTQDIERFFEDELKKHPGMTPAFKGYNGFPGSLCVSVNDVVIHGIPSPRKVINDGDIVSVDLGIGYRGTFVDTATTYIVGSVSPVTQKLCQVAREALEAGIALACKGKMVSDISAAIQRKVETNGFSVVRQFVGHGIGRALHMSPEVPNFIAPLRGAKLKEGMALAIEPMISAGSWEVEVAEDGWTALMKDGSLSAHFEHTVVITVDGPMIVTQ